MRRFHATKSEQPTKAFPPASLARLITISKSRYLSTPLLLAMSKQPCMRIVHIVEVPCTHPVITVVIWRGRAPQVKPATSMSHFYRLLTSGLLPLHRHTAIVEVLSHPSVDFRWITLSSWLVLFLRVALFRVILAVVFTSIAAALLLLLLHLQSHSFSLNTLDFRTTTSRWLRCKCMIIGLWIILLGCHLHLFLRLNSWGFFIRACVWWTSIWRILVHYTTFLLVLCFLFLTNIVGLSWLLKGGSSFVEYIDRLSLWCSWLSQLRGPFDILYELSLDTIWRAFIRLLVEWVVCIILKMFEFT
jgi:hypothetical protein